MEGTKVREIWIVACAYDVRLWNSCFYIVVFLYFFAVFPSKLKKSIWMQNQFSILVYLFEEMCACHASPKQQRTEANQVTHARY